METNISVLGGKHADLLPPARPRNAQPLAIAAPNGATFDFQYTVNPTPGVKGTLVDEAGKPVEGAVVRLSFETDYMDTARGSGGQAVSDAAGRFSLPVAGNGIKLRARKGQLALFEPVVITDNNRDLKLVLRRSQPGSLVVHVVQDNGQPIAGADVVVTESDGFQGYAPRWGRTAPDGTFLVSPVRQDRNYSITVSAKGHTSGRTTAKPLSGQKVDVPPITLKNTDSFIAGRVTDQNGRPIANAEVRVMGGSATGAPGAFAGAKPIRTDAQGRFRIENLVDDETVSITTTVDGRTGRPTRIDTGVEDVVIVHTPTTPLVTPTPPPPAGGLGGLP